ncbi:shikimate kinase [Flavobacteriaceae bacterium Ap0902]|nr:shikimate kinase [Flavobacteriaceae bacterium Ap0902]
MKISLVGYMGSGKSSVGEYLSRQLSIPFFDLDSYIVEKENQTIPAIFKNKGEIYFRKIENLYLKELLGKEEFVLATGGGTPIFYNSMDDMNAHSATIYLQNSPTALAERLKYEKATRPLIAHIQDEDLTEFVAKHLFERNAFYQKATYTLNTHNKSIEIIGNEIIEKIKTHQNPS